MSYQTAITIKEALDNIRSKSYAMPAIQREFVWSEEQIERLFDSLMQGYPIGAFLFWDVQNTTVKDYRWYGFVTDYHQRKRKHNPELEPSIDDSGLTAVLDGQQRLTALNIGLQGSYASKLPRLRWDNEGAYPAKSLYFNIDTGLEDDEFGRKYEFKFLSEDEFDSDKGVGKWFKVSTVMDMVTEVGEIDHGAPYRYMSRNGLFNQIMTAADQTIADKRLERLTKLPYAVHEYKPISFFLEREQNLQKVLNIFIRTNSGGTVLSNSDLLMSIAVAQFKRLDARQEVHDLTDELNEIGDRFNFPRDFILKAGLVLADITDVGFDVKNFNRTNMQKLEGQWEAIASSVRTTVKLASTFGLSGDKLPSQNSLLPIAYYLRTNNFDSSFITRAAYRDERKTIRQWLFRTLIRRVWGGASDTLLERLRSVIREHGHGKFPEQQLSSSLAGAGRGLVFDDEQLDDIVDTEYGSYAFVLMSMLYSSMDVLGGRFHMDHIFPKSKFSRPSMEREGLTYDQGTEVRERMNRLANLQLLSGTDNASKGNMMPNEWLDEEFTSRESRANYVLQHDLGDVPGDIREFVDWYETRRETMLDRLRGILGQRPR